MQRYQDPETLPDVENMNGDGTALVFRQRVRSLIQVDNTLNAGITVDFLSLTTPTLPAGDYRIHVSYIWRLDSVAQSFIGFVEHIGAGSFQMFDHHQEPSDAGGLERFVFSYTDTITFAGGNPLDLRLRFTKTNNASTASIFQAYLEVERVG